MNDTTPCRPISKEELLTMIAAFYDQIMQQGFGSISIDFRGGVATIKQSSVLRHELAPRP